MSDPKDYTFNNEDGYPSNDDTNESENVEDTSEELVVDGIDESDESGIYLDVDNMDDVEEVGDKNNFDLIYRFNTNKHRQEGKHTLKRDTIFKGKLDKKEDEDEPDLPIEPQNEYNDIVTFFNNQCEEEEDYLNQNNLTKDVYDILDEKTELDFTQNRRKPNKATFNEYYNLLLVDLGFRYTKSEIFVELSYYFTDNIFNMFKLLDKVPATIILKELRKKGFLKNLDGLDFE